MHCRPAADSPGCTPLKLYQNNSLVESHGHRDIVKFHVSSDGCDYLGQVIVIPEMTAKKIKAMKNKEWMEFLQND